VRFWRPRILSARRWRRGVFVTAQPTIGCGKDLGELYRSMSKAPELVNCGGGVSGVDASFITSTVVCIGNPLRTGRAEDLEVPLEGKIMEPGRLQRSSFRRNRYL